MIVYTSIIQSKFSVEILHRHVVNLVFSVHLLSIRSLTLLLNNGNPIASDRITSVRSICTRTCTSTCSTGYTDNKSTIMS